MNLEDSRHNLRIVGKIFLVLGLIIIPVSILSYNSINFFIESDWFHFDDHLDFGVIHLAYPLKIFYGIPALYLLTSLILIGSGVGLIKDYGWGQKVSVIPAILLLFWFPFGTALGLFLIYNLQKLKSEGAASENGESA